MPSIAERRTLTRRNLFIVAQQDPFQKTKTVKALANFAPASHDQLKKVIKQLEEVAKQQREKREECEGQLILMRQRAVLRQRQFHSVISTTHKEIKKHLSNGCEKESTVSEILQIFQQIFVKFQQANEATHTFIENRYKQNLAMMERRIFTIMESFDAEVAKNKRLSDESCRNIRAQIEKVLSIGRHIDEQNLKIKTQLSELSFKLKISQEERNLLINEIVQKKAVISKLYERIKNRKCGGESVDNYRANPSVRQQSKTSLRKSICEPSEFSENKSVNLRKLDPRYSKVSLNKTKKIEDHIYLSIPYKKGGDNLAERTIQHLKLCLEREKKKVLELGKIVSQLQTNNKSINQAILEQLSQNKHDVSSLLKSQKLFDTIKTLKQRLAACENPSVNSGWGGNDLNQFMITESEFMRQQS